MSRTSATRRMGPGLRRDDAECVAASCVKFPNSNFKQPSALVLAPPREFELLVDLPFLRGDGAPNDAPLVVTTAPFGRSIAGFVAKGPFFRRLGCLAARRFRVACLSPSSQLQWQCPVLGPDGNPSSLRVWLARHSRGRRIRPAWVTPPRSSFRSVPLQ